MIDKFGAGKDGFEGSVPGPPTQLEAVWYDNMQEEMANAIEDQGYVLDGLTLNQLSFALNNYGFGGVVGFTNGSTLTFASGAILTMDAGSTFQCNTDLAEFTGDLIIGDDATDVLTVMSSAVFQSVVFLNGDVNVGNNVGDVLTVNATATFNENITVSTATLTVPTIDQTNSSGSIATGEVRLYSDVAPSPNAGVLQWDGRTLNCGDASLATGRRVAMPFDSYIAGDINTVNAIADTGASVGIVMLTGEKCIVEMHSEMTNTNVGSTVNFRIEANGVTVGGTAVRNIATAGVYVSAYRTISFTAAADILYTFTARYGAAAGTTTARNVLLTVRRSS